MRRVAVSACILVGLALAPGLGAQSGLSRDVLVDHLPVAREVHYVVNARIRPLVVFWMGRENIGGARVTWRADALGGRAIELLVGSDPARTPRRINRWGFVVESGRAGSADVFGLMKESDEETLEEARAAVERRGGDTTRFKAVWTSVRGPYATTGSTAFDGEPNLTFEQLDAVLQSMPAEPPSLHQVTLPSGTETGFLAAMTALMRTSAEPCRRPVGRDPARQVAQVPYLYHRTVFDLSITGCTFEEEFRTRRGRFADVVDGRFQVRNRRTGELTKFQVAFSLSDRMRDVPVRVVFRPRWWIEVELIAADLPTSQ